MADKKRFTVFGRVINHSVWEQESYKDKVTGKVNPPAYKVELAMEQDEVMKLHAELAAYAVQKWGPTANDLYYNGTIFSPVKDGTQMAAKLAMEGKPGDAYDGKFVIRSHTQFNRNGENAPGGIQVFMAPDPSQPEAVVELGFEQRDQIYRGCYGRVGLTIGDYVHSSGKNALTLYLVAFCKTNEGERIVGTSDHSTLFSPNGAASAATPPVAGQTPMPVGSVVPPTATDMPPAAPVIPGGVVVVPTPGMPAAQMPPVAPALPGAAAPGMPPNTNGMPPAATPAAPAPINPAATGMPPVDPRQTRVG